MAFPIGVLVSSAFLMGHKANSQTPELRQGCDELLHTPQESDPSAR
jgi:hypothetical protein